MDIWSGCISAESDSSLTLPLEDLRLSTPSSATTPSSVLSHLTSSLSAARLSLISLIDPTRIPLFLAAGPSLELTTTSPTTSSCFRKLFLSSLPTQNDSLDCRTVEQSRIALLVRVTNDLTPTDGSWKVTELAIYGAISYPQPPPTTPSKNTANLTPPNSSPADTPTPCAIVTVHALPLSSHHAFLSHLSSAKPEPQSPSAPKNILIHTDSANDAVFIAPNPQDTLNPSISQSAKKRGAAVLDAAADPRKRAKRSNAPPPPLSLLGGVALNRKVRAESASRGVLVKRERSPSPSPSFPPLRGRRSVSGGMQVRRRESTMEMMRPASSSSGIVKKEIYGEVETKNRAELAKVVVAGMKACGLKDYRSGRGKSVLGVGDEEEREREKEKESEKEKVKEREKEEYKQIYYHTVKAAAFALRGVISVGSVNADKMREVVDRLLGMFCEPKTGQLLLEAAGAEECRERS